MWKPRKEQVKLLESEEYKKVARILGKDSCPSEGETAESLSYHYYNNNN